MQACLFLGRFAEGAQGLPALRAQNHSAVVPVANLAPPCLWVRDGGQLHRHAEEEPLLVRGEPFLVPDLGPKWLRTMTLAEVVVARVVVVVFEVEVIVVVEVVVAIIIITAIVITSASRSVVVFEIIRSMAVKVVVEMVVATVAMVVVVVG